MHRTSWPAVRVDRFRTAVRAGGPEWEGQRFGHHHVGAEQQWLPTTGILSAYSVEDIDEKAITEFIQARTCRRRVLSQHLDGESE